VRIVSAWNWFDTRAAGRFDANPREIIVALDRAKRRHRPGPHDHLHHRNTRQRPALATLGSSVNDTYVLVACDKFKGSLSSEEVGAALADGLDLAGVGYRVLPVADGGEGTARALLSAMTGCGGGLSGGLWACFSAELTAGADLVLDALGFDRLLWDAALVITGEGRIDAQTREGKLVAAVARRSKDAGIPCIAVVGRDELGADEGRRLGVTRIVEAGTTAQLREFGRGIGSALQLGGALRERDA
jgi:hypothetical protein